MHDIMKGDHKLYSYNYLIFEKLVRTKKKKKKKKKFVDAH